MFARSLCFGSLLLLAASAARAAEPEAVPEPEPAPPPAGPSQPPPYSAWQGTGHAAPVGAAPLVGPPPSVGAPEYSRRTVELIPALGLVLPNCRAGSQSDDRCDGVSTGGVVGFTGLWRVTPYFAWGGGFEIVAFGYEPPEELGLTDAGAGAVWLGLQGRVYFNDDGSLDPYVQLGIGVGALGTTAADPSGTTWEETGAGPAGQLGGGVDFHLSRSIKLGPAVAYTRVFVDKIRRCRASGDGDCVDVSKDANGHLDSYFSLTARLTILLGGEL